MIQFINSKTNVFKILKVSESEKQHFFAEMMVQEVIMQVLEIFLRSMSILVVICCYV